MAKCSTCGKETYRYTVRFGEQGEQIDCGRCSGAPSGYQPFKAYWDNNIADQPVYVSSINQHNKLLKSRGLEVRPREHIDDLNHRRWKKGLPPLAR